MTNGESKRGAWKRRMGSGLAWAIAVVACLCCASCGILLDEFWTG